MKFVNVIAFALCALISKLPYSPFEELLSSIGDIPFLGFINFFIPFDFASIALSSWAVCIISWRIYKLVRFVFMELIFKTTSLEE